MDQIDMKSNMDKSDAQLFLHALGREEKINLAWVRDQLLNAVHTQGPDFVYNPDGVYTCHYVPNEDGPRSMTVTGCIVGVVLKDALAMFPIQFSMGIMSAWGSTPHIRLAMTHESVVYLQAAQAAQDAGHTWGQTYMFAESLAYMGTLDEADIYDALNIFSRSHQRPAVPEDD